MFSGEQISFDELYEIIEAGSKLPLNLNSDDFLITSVQSDGMLERLSSNIVSTLPLDISQYGQVTVIIISSNSSSRKAYAAATHMMASMISSAEKRAVYSAMLPSVVEAISLDENLMEDLGIKDGRQPIVAAAFGYEVEHFSLKSQLVPIYFVTDG